MTVRGPVFKIFHNGIRDPEYLIANNVEDAEKEFRKHNQTDSIEWIEQIGYGSIVMMEVDER